jgi:hypothetical protein
MSVEIHVQCRLAKAGYMGVRELAMTPNPVRDAVFVIVYVFGKDHGGGESIEILEKGALNAFNDGCTLTFDDLSEKLSGFRHR